MKWEDKQYNEVDHCVICGKAFQSTELEEVEDHPAFIGDEESNLVCADCMPLI